MNLEDVSAYVVVFSVEDRSSFSAAIDKLYEIRRETISEHHPMSLCMTSNPPRPAVILVANKVDLVRNRTVLEKGIFSFSFTFLSASLYVSKRGAY